MAIFNSSTVSNKNSKTDSNTTIITTGTKFKGEIELNCSLYIDGEIEGMIQSSKDIKVGTNGHVKGTIVTDKLTVQGYIEGTIDAQTVVIKSSGHVRGEISSVELIIESKGIFEGNSVIKDKKESAPKALEKKS